MNKFAIQKMNKSDVNHKDYDAKRKRYSVSSFNCGHFAEEVILKGNTQVDRPNIVNFLPNNIVDEYVEEGNAEVLFDPNDGSISVGKGDESDAKD